MKLRNLLAIIAVLSMSMACKLKYDRTPEEKSSTGSSVSGQQTVTSADSVVKKVSWSIYL